MAARRTRSPSQAPSEPNAETVRVTCYQVDVSREQQQAIHQQLLELLAEIYRNLK
jgi:hypothetical protein